MKKQVSFAFWSVMTLLLVTAFTGLTILVQAQDDELDHDLSRNDPQAVFAPLGTGFSYQGWLQDGNSPASGPYDFQFKLFDASAGGAQVGDTITRNDLAVNAGVFSTNLDFGLSPFSASEARWLEIAVRPGPSTGAYTTLSPRTAVRANPYALVSGRLRSPDGQAIMGVSSDGTGTMSLRGPNGNLNFSVSSSSENRDLGWLRLYDENGGTMVHLAVQGTTNKNGQLLLNGPNGNRNITLDVSTGSSNRGYIAIHDTAGTARAFMRINSSNVGEISSGIVFITGGSDLAEPFVVNGVEKVEPGMVVVLDPNNPGQMRLATQAYDPLVAGVISGAGGVNPGIIMHQEDRQIEGETHPVALTGQVYVWAVGPIKVGDLLTSSDIPGFAMAAADRDRAFGTIIGKAMTTLDEGEGLVLILVTLQ
jgi:hypothetical protein